MVDVESFRKAEVLWTSAFLFLGAKVSTIFREGQGNGGSVPSSVSGV